MSHVIYTNLAIQQYVMDWTIASTAERKQPSEDHISDAAGHSVSPLFTYISEWTARLRKCETCCPAVCISYIERQCIRSCAQLMRYTYIRTVYIYIRLVSWEEWHSVRRVFAIVQKLYKVTCLYIFYIYCQKQELLYIHLKRDTNLRALRIYNIQVRSNSTIIRTHIIIYIGKVLRRAIWHITQYVSTTSKWWWQISSFYYINFRYACTAVLFNSFQL